MESAIPDQVERAARRARIFAWHVAAVLAICLVANPTAAAASNAEVQAVFWSSQTSDRSRIDEFFRCLTLGSSFSGAWSSEFGLSSVTYLGSYVLTDPLPATISEPSLLAVLSAAFDDGLVPGPTAGIANEYILFTPSTTLVGTLCSSAKAGCGEHDAKARYKGITFDYGVAPIAPCNCHGTGNWTSVFDEMTNVGEHEVAEGLARLGGASYEVGDACEMPIESIACCGVTYVTQGLAGSGGASTCHPVTSTGSAAACAADAGADASSSSSGSGAGPRDGGFSGVDAGTSASGSSSGSTSSGGASSSGSSGGASSTSSTGSSGSASSAGSTGSTSSGGSASGTSSSGSGASSSGGDSGSSISSQASDASSATGLPGAVDSGCGCSMIGVNGGALGGPYLLSLLALARARRTRRRRVS